MMAVASRFRFDFRGHPLMGKCRPRPFWRAGATRQVSTPPQEQGTHRDMIGT